MFSIYVVMQAYMTWHKQIILFSLGGESGWQQHLPQAPPVQRQAVGRGHIWVSCHWLQWHHGTTSPCSGLPPGGTGAGTTVRWHTAPGIRAPVTGEHSPPSPSQERGQGTEEEISWQLQWLQWKLCALERYQHTQSPQSRGISHKWTLCILFVYLYHCCLDANVVECQRAIFYWQYIWLGSLYCFVICLCAFSYYIQLMLIWKLGCNNKENFYVVQAGLLQLPSN